MPKLPTACTSLSELPQMALSSLLPGTLTFRALQRRRPSTRIVIDASVIRRAC